MIAESNEFLISSAFFALLVMEDFLIYNSLEHRKYPDAFKDNYHCHILCRSGEMQFTAVGKEFPPAPGTW